jgi:uncharacterized repeat protein (TIGR03943 family)
MNESLRRSLQAIAVLCWAGVLLYFHGSGRINKYLAPDFRPLCLAGGLGLGVLGSFTLLTARQRGNCGHQHAAGDHCAGSQQHPGDLNPWFALAVMAVPLGLAATATRDGFSQDALARKGLYDPLPASSAMFFTEDLPPLTREQVEQAHPRDPAGYHEFNLLELFFATGDRGLQGLLEGMQVRTEGRIADELEGTGPHRKRLYRLFITCCAADSRAIPIVLEFAAPPPRFDANGWIVARGTIRYRLEDGRLNPVLQVADATPGEAPSEESFMRGRF